MPIHDFSSERLFVDAPLSVDRPVPLSSEQAHYLLNVLRLKEAAEILVFNGRDGEWLAELSSAAKRGAALTPRAQTRLQENGPDIDYLFAPLKHARLDYMVQKATELGVQRLRPVLTRRTIADRVNLDRMRSNAIEAAEQCGILSIPEVAEPQKFDRMISEWDGARTLIFCDESAEESAPIDALRKVNPGPLAVLIGPEGGFDPTEREALLARPFTVRISLGPRILRADTAAVAALALVNATLGDWTLHSRKG
jgi:16S rRNA (uracil1498-N3)-methyltransferase